MPGNTSWARSPRSPASTTPYPVLDTAGNLSAIVIAGFKLDEYTSFIERAKLPEGSAVVIMDQRGVRLYRLPENEKTPLGRPVSSSAFERIGGKAQEGVYEDTGADGIYRIYAFKQLRLRDNQPPYLYIAVGIPKEGVLQKASMVMLGSLSVLGIIALGAAALAWAFGNRFLVRPINQLVRATAGLASGEMGVRTGIPHTADDLGELAKSFDEMAYQLEVRTTEQKKTEEALRESEKQYRTIVETAREGIWVIDEQAKTSFVNRQMAEMLGHTVEEMQGRSLYEFTGATERLEAEHYFERRKQCIGEQLDFRFRKKDGSFLWAIVSTNPLFGAEGQFIGALAMVTDITQRKQAEEELRLLPSRLLSVQEEERKRLAHELHDSIGGTLSALKYSLENARNRMEEGETTPETLDQLIGMVQGAIGEARRIYMDLRPSILDDLGLIATIGWFTRQFQTVYTDVCLENHIEVEEKGIPEDLKIVIFRVIQESFHNISKYSKADRVRLSLAGRDGSLDLAIADNGAGFDVAQASAGRSNKGGIGLSSMRERVEFSGGAFSVESIIGEGTTVRAGWDTGKLV